MVGVSRGIIGADVKVRPHLPDIFAYFYGISLALIRRAQVLFLCEARDIRGWERAWEHRATATLMCMCVICSLSLSWPAMAGVNTFADDIERCRIGSCYNTKKLIRRGACLPLANCQEIICERGADVAIHLSSPLGLILPQRPFNQTKSFDVLLPPFVFILDHVPPICLFSFSVFVLCDAKRVL